MTIKDGGEELLTIRGIDSEENITYSEGLCKKLKK